MTVFLKCQKIFTSKRKSWDHFFAHKNFLSKFSFLAENQSRENSQRDIYSMTLNSLETINFIYLKILQKIQNFFLIQFNIFIFSQKEIKKMIKTNTLPGIQTVKTAFPIYWEDPYLMSISAARAPRLSEPSTQTDVHDEVTYKIDRKVIGK